MSRFFGPSTSPATRVSMNDLQAAFTTAGCANARTFIQSGNVVFDAAPRRLSPLVRQIRATLESLLGEEPQLVIRTVDDLVECIADFYAAVP